MKTSIKVEGLEELKKTLTDLQKEQFPYAMARSLTKVAQNVKSIEITEMKTSLDRPTPYALGSLYTQAATKKNLTSVVAFKDKSTISSGNPAATFIAPQIEGGVRNTKAFESALVFLGVMPPGYYVVPAKGYALDQYGNIPLTIITEIIKYFRTNKPTQNLYGNLWGIKETGYFAITNNAKSRLPLGIYKRSSIGKKSKVQLIMRFISKTNYKKRLQFFEKAQEKFDSDFKQIFNESMDEALKTAK